MSFSKLNKRSLSDPTESGRAEKKHKPSREPVKRRLSFSEAVDTPEAKTKVEMCDICQCEAGFLGCTLKTVGHYNICTDGEECPGCINYCYLECGCFYHPDLHGDPSAEKYTKMYCDACLYGWNKTTPVCYQCSVHDLDRDVYVCNDCAEKKEGVWSACGHYLVGTCKQWTCYDCKNPFCTVCQAEPFLVDGHSFCRDCAWNRPPAVSLTAEKCYNCGLAQSLDGRFGLCDDKPLCMGTKDNPGCYDKALLDCGCLYNKKIFDEKGENKGEVNRRCYVCDRDGGSDTPVCWQCSTVAEDGSSLLCQWCTNNEYLVLAECGCLILTGLDTAVTCKNPECQAPHFCELCTDDIDPEDTEDYTCANCRE